MTTTHLKPALETATERVELLDVRPVGHREATVLQAHNLFRGLVLADGRKQLSERSPLLLLRLTA